MNNVEDANIKAALSALVDSCGGQRPAAEAIGISPQYLHDVLSGRRWITEAVADKLGFKRVVVYRKKDED